MVHRPGRHDRRVVGRVQRGAGGDAPAAGAARDRADPLHDRPLPLGRALRLRHAAGARVGRLAGRDGGRDGAAAAARPGRLRLGRGLARPPRADAAVAAREARAIRAATPTGGTARGARTGPRSRARCWRSAAGSTPTRTRAWRCSSTRRRRPGDHRPVGPHASARRLAGPARRPPRADGAVVRPVPERRRQRRRPRAAADRVPARRRRAGAVPRRRARPLARLHGVAVGGAADRAPPGGRDARGRCAARAAGAHLGRAAVGRPRARRGGAPARRRSASRRTWAPTTATRCASTRRPSIGRSRSSASRSWSSRSPPTGRWRWSRRGSSTSIPTAGRRWSAAAAST